MATDRKMDSFVSLGRRSAWVAAMALFALTGCARVDETVGSPAKGPANTPPATNWSMFTSSELAQKADVPIYPGAALPEGASNARDNQGQTRFEIVMSSHDMPETILKFYASKLRREGLSLGNASVMGMSPTGNYVIIKTSRMGDRTDINVVATHESATVGSK